ncbi:MAG: hypothetical protein RMK94_15285 [Armatimonadota bacterium]|nr:hypothetical protein [Armatimonadota bacterium]
MLVKVTVTSAKAGLKSGHDLEIQLNQGLNMLGNPSTTPLLWDDDHVRVRIHWISKKWFGLKKRVKNKVVPLSQAIAEGWLKDKIALWDPSAASYYYVDDNVGQLVPVGQGFLLAANRGNLTLLIRP